MQLESKFIKKTNEQYSIRNDGVVIRHYMDMRCGRIFNEKQLKISSIKAVAIYINKKKRSFNLQTLLFDYFNFRLCNKCNSKIYERLNKTCEYCKKEQIRVSDLKHYYLNSDKEKEIQKKSYEKRKQNVSMTFVATSLRIKKKDLDFSVYQAAKARILIKRKIKQLQNG
jgi:hypothetical protein